MDTVTATQMNSQSSSSANVESLGLSNSAMAALGYFCGLAAIVALVVSPYNQDRKARFHAVQALLFQGSWLVGSMALAVVSLIVSAILSTLLSALKLYAVAAVLFSLGSILSLVFSLSMFAVYVYLVVAAATDRNPRLPILAQYADRMSASGVGQ